MPFRTDRQSGEEEEDEGEDAALLAKREIRSMALAGPGGDLNKIRRSQQTASWVNLGADGELDEEAGGVDEVVREVLREAELASDRGKQGG